MLAPAGEARRAFAGQRVLDYQLPGERQYEGDDRDGDRPPHTVGRYHHCDTSLGAGLDVDRVVADAETRHDGQSAVRRDAVRRETLDQENERIEINELLGADRVHGLKIAELHAGSLAQGFEIEIRKDRRALGFEEIAGQGDAIDRAHDFFLAFFGAQASRNLPSASASASCGTQMSPE